MKRRRSSRPSASRARARAPAVTGSPRVTLEHLPAEILHQVFSYFCPHCCPKQTQPRPPTPNMDGSYRFITFGPPVYTRLEILRALCRLSRRIRSVAQEVLFHVFSVSDQVDQLVPFIRTVMERRDLARVVRVIKISRSVFMSSNPIPPSLVETVSRQAAQAQSLDLCRSWRGRLENDEEWPPEFQTLLKSFLDDGPTRTRIPRRARPEVVNEWLMGELFTLLVGSLPRLESLYFEDSVDMSHFHPPALRALGVADIPIKKLGICTWAPTLLSFATNLEALSLTGIDIMYRIPPLPRLKELEIRGVWLSLQQVRYLFSMCTGELRTFLYESQVSVGPRGGRPRDRVFSYRNGVPLHWRNYESTDLLDLEHDEILMEPEQMANVKDVLACLRNHRQSITCLRFHTRYAYLVAKPVPDFRPFVALRHLNVHISMIGTTRPTHEDPTIADVLPESIESITFRGTLSTATNMAAFEGHMDRVVQMISRVPAPLPNLTRIICDKVAQYPVGVVHNLASVGVHFSHVPRGQGTSGYYFFG